MGEGQARLHRLDRELPARPRLRRGLVLAPRRREEPRRPRLPRGPELADATLGWLLRTFRAYEEGDDPEKTVAWQLGRVLQADGCKEPSVWEMHALSLARPGREADLVAAIAACDTGLAGRPKVTTASGWGSLAMTRDLLALRLTAVQRGHEIRHHPGPKAKRARKLRFS